MYGSNVNFCFRELTSKEDGITIAISPGQRKSLVTMLACTSPSGSYLFRLPILKNGAASYTRKQQVEQLMLAK